LIDSVEERVRYVVPLSPPISVQTPISGTATATEMAGPMNAQRIVNSINAVTKLLEVVILYVTSLVKLATALQLIKLLKSKASRA